MPTDTPEPLSDAELEALAAEIHIVYCEEYERRFGEPYWTGGDYSKLDEPTKNYDRNLVRWHLDKTAAAREELEQAKAHHTSAHAIIQSLLVDRDAVFARAEAAEAACAALRADLEWMKAAFEEGRKIESENLTQHRPAAVSIHVYAAICQSLAQPNPGAGLLERMRHYEADLYELRTYYEAAVADLVETGSGIACAPECEHMLCRDYKAGRAALAQAGEQEQAT